MSEGSVASFFSVFIWQNTEHLIISRQALHQVKLPWFFVDSMYGSVKPCTSTTEDVRSRPRAQRYASHLTRCCLFWEFLHSCSLSVPSFQCQTVLHCVPFLSRWMYRRPERVRRHSFTSSRFASAERISRSWSIILLEMGLFGEDLVTLFAPAKSIDLGSSGI